MFSVVVLPQPDGPSSARRSPASTVTETPRTATCPAYALLTSRNSTEATNESRGIRERSGAGRHPVARDSLAALDFSVPPIGPAADLGVHRLEVEPDHPGQPVRTVRHAAGGLRVEPGLTVDRPEEDVLGVQRLRLGRDQVVHQF